MAPLKKITYAAQHPILIVEDTKETQVLLQGICKSMDLPSAVAENGEVALKLLDEKQFSIYIVDIMMPVMDGKTLISHLKKKIPDAVILVESALDSSKNVIDIMKMGVFDYIIKPIDPEMFQNSLYKALEYYKLKENEKNTSLHAGLKIRNQIEWLNYKESRRVVDRDYSGTKSIYNLKTSLSQGAGFGTLVSLIDLLQNMLVDQGDTYSVSKDIMGMLLENNLYCRNQLDGLRAVTGIMEHDFTLTKTTAADLVVQLPGMFSIVEPYFKSKDLRITLPEMKVNCRLELNMEKVGLMIEELAINAYKYSIPGSTINIFTHISEGYLWLSVKNDVPEEPYGGIPRDYEKLVMEPFFRLLPPDESAAKIEKFGFGLGLTVVDNIIRKHNGVFLIHDVKDHTGKNVKSCVMAEALFPLMIDEME